MADHDYEAGLRDGKIEALEKMQASQNKRIDKHDNRLSNLEKATYGVLGIIFIIQFGPYLKAFIA